MVIGLMEIIDISNGDLHIGQYDGDITFAHLHHETPWKQRSILVHGREVKQPRLTALYGCDYRYSNRTIKGLPWSGSIKKLREEVETLLGIEFNSALLNLYRDGYDSIGWHSDDEPELGHKPIVASFSFGSARTFSLRRRDGTDALDIPLIDNSILVMSGDMQKYWQHSIQREKNDMPRINVTFRRINLH